MTTHTKPADGMTLAAFKAAREAIFAAAQSFDQVVADCRRCKHFELGDCKHFGAPVPAEFQAAPEQCEAWVFDGIPF